jgi:hypothetical protein
MRKFIDAVQNPAESVQSLNEGNRPVPMRNLMMLVESLMEATEPQNPNRISTRLPTSKRAGPIRHDLTVDTDTAKTDRKSFEHNVDLVKQYAALPTKDRKGKHDKVADKFIDHVKDNLLFLHDQMPEEQRQRARLWYDGASKLTKERADQYGLPHSTTAAVYAALSPQKTWHENASIGDRVLDAFMNHQGTKWTKEMEETALRIWHNDRNKPIHEAIRNMRLGDLVDIDHKAAWIRTFDESHNPSHYPMVEPEGRLGRTYTNGDAYGPGAKNPEQIAKVRWGSIAEVSKAIGAIESLDDLDRISTLMGERHKVRNFYNNIVDPNGKNGDVTIDTHAVAAGLLHPLGGNTTEVAHNFKNTLPASDSTKGFIPAKGSVITGVHGTYPLYADAYRRAAAEREILPREMQSITWEAARGLFNGKGNGKAKHLAAIKGLWKNYQDGILSADDVRKQIHDISGGIQPPDWTKE